MGPARTPQFDPKASKVQFLPPDRDSDYGRRGYHHQNDADRNTPQIIPNTRPFSADDENSRNESYRLDRNFRVASPQDPMAAKGPPPQRKTSSKRSPWKQAQAVNWQQDIQRNTILSEGAIDDDNTPKMDKHISKHGPTYISKTQTKVPKLNLDQAYDHDKGPSPLA